MNNRWLSLIALTTLALPFSLQAQPAAAKSPTPVRASVGDVTDSRSTSSFNSECKLELKFTGDAAADALKIREVHVAKALDELGRDLVLPAESDAFSGSFFSSSGDRSGGALKAEVKLRNPSRNASLIKVIEGEVEFFHPTPSNGGVVVINDILKHPAEPVPDAALKQYNVQLIYLTKESYDAKKKQMEQNKSSATGDAIAEVFSGMFGGAMSSDSKNSIILFVKDPDKRVIDLEFQDAAGKPLNRRGSWSSNEMRTQQFDAPPPPDTRLRIHLATPASIQAVPFKIENIPLP